VTPDDESPKLALASVGRSAVTPDARRLSLFGGGDVSGEADDAGDSGCAELDNVDG
jgi:hypothetical protein